MTIRRRDRGLSGDDMGCDGSWDMTDDLLERLREVPDAAPLFDALADVPGVWVVGGAVRDALLGRAPRDLDLVVEGDAADGRTAAGRGAAGPRALRHGDDRRRRQPRRRPPRALRAARRAARGRARRADRGGPRAARLHRQRDRACGWPTASCEAVPGALEDLAARRLRVLHDRSFLDDPTRLLRLIRYAARLRFQIEQGTREQAFAAVEGGALATVDAVAAGRRAAAAAGRADAGRHLRARGVRDRPGARPGLRGRPRPRRARPAPHAPRRPRPTSSRWPPAASTPPRPCWPSASTGSSCPPASATPWSPPPPAHAASRRCSAGWSEPSGIWALLRREAPETVALAGALGRERERAPLARGAAPREAGHHRRRPARRRVSKARRSGARSTPRPPRCSTARPATATPARGGASSRVVERPRSPAGRPSRTRRRRPRASRDNRPVDLPAPFTGATSTSAPRCPAATCCSRPAAAASPRARSPRSTSGG